MNKKRLLTFFVTPLVFFALGSCSESENGDSDGAAGDSEPPETSTANEVEPEPPVWVPQPEPESKPEPTPPPASDAPPEEPKPYAEEFHFEEFEVGEEPDLFILDGSFTVEAVGDNKVLQLGPEPLTDGSIQLGKSLKTGGEIQATVTAEAKRRSFPRFAVGLHGMSGFKLRVVPVKKEIELVRNDEAVASAPFTDWKSGEACILNLTVSGSAEDGWKVKGMVSMDGVDGPQAEVEYEAEPVRLQGKGSIIGTPYAGLPIQFDDVRIFERP